MAKKIVELFALCEFFDYCTLQKDALYLKVTYSYRYNITFNITTVSNGDIKFYKMNMPRPALILLYLHSQSTIRNATQFMLL